MSWIEVVGGYPLNGEILIQGSKNAALPILAAALLCKGMTVIYGCPHISDVSDTAMLLRTLGCTVEQEQDRLMIDSSGPVGTEVTEKTAEKMRSSMMLLGALLGRAGEATVCYPGGCVIGKRPIDLHLSALRAMGAEITETENRIECRASRLHGAIINFPFVSVGATENVILASVLAEGTTTIQNAATEPEIGALCAFLNACGAKINGIGSRLLRIYGVEALKPCSYTLPADRIVAGTYLTAAAATGGQITIVGVPVKEIASVLEVLNEGGCRISAGSLSVRLKAPGRLRAVPYTETKVYPGFPTDMQSPMAAALTVAEGTSVIRETIFEKRFRIIPELKKLGACVETSNDLLFIEGKKRLTGCTVKAEELRGSAALVIAGMLAEGKTVIEQTEFLKRGYCDIVSDLNSLGARLTWVEA